MTDLPTCPECTERPVPTARSKRCLACAKKRPGGAWRQMIARYRNKHGEEAAREFAAAQGVPYSPAASAADGKPKQTAGAVSPVKAGPQDDGVPEAGRIEPRDVEPHRLAGLAGHALEDALEYLIKSLPEVSPGQLAQTVKPVHGIYSELAGGTTAGTILTVFADEDPDGALASVLDFCRSGELDAQRVVDELTAAGLLAA